MIMLLTLHAAPIITIAIGRVAPASLRNTGEFNGIGAMEITCALTRSVITGHLPAVSRATLCIVCTDITDEILLFTKAIIAELSGTFVNAISVVVTRAEADGVARCIQDFFAVVTLAFVVTCAEVSQPQFGPASAGRWFGKERQSRGYVAEFIVVTVSVFRALHAEMARVVADLVLLTVSVVVATTPARSLSEQAARPLRNAIPTLTI
jgi:hypothetical protein